MVTLAVLGTGLLGSGFVESLLDKGHQVRVWNRTREKMKPLVELGAVAADDPADAAQEAERVHLVLSADDAVDEVIAALRPGLGDGVFVVDHSPNSPARTAVRFDELRAAGMRYVHAPVFMSPRNAREASGLMLLAAPQGEADELARPLGAMTGKLWHTGERPDRAAFHKLAGNGLIIGMNAVLGDLLAMGRRSGLSNDDVLGLFDMFKPGAAIGSFGRSVATAGERPASFELAMARKDVSLMLEAAGDGPLSVLPAVAAAMDRALAEGRKHQDFTVFARLDRR